MGNWCQKQVFNKQWLNASKSMFAAIIANMCLMPENKYFNDRKYR